MGLKFETLTNIFLISVMIGDSIGAKPAAPTIDINTNNEVPALNIPPSEILPSSSFYSNPTVAPVPTPSVYYRAGQEDRHVEPIPQSTLKLQSDIQKLVNESTGSQSIYIHEIGTGVETGVYINQNDKLLAASTMKLPLVIAAMKVFQENDIDFNNYSDPYTGLPIKTVLREILVNHNNVYSVNLNKLIVKLGCDANTILKEMGAPDIDVKNNLISAKSAAIILEGLTNNTLGLDEDENDFIYNLLTEDSLVNDRLFKWSFRNKLNEIGSFDNIVGSLFEVSIPVDGVGVVTSVSNDMGILTTKDGAQFVIVINQNYGPKYDVTKENEFISQVSKLLIEFISGN